MRGPRPKNVVDSIPGLSAQKSKLLCPELPGLQRYGHRKLKKMLETATNPVDKDLTERGRNVGGNVDETGSSVGSLVAWCGFRFFLSWRKGLVHAMILWKLSKTLPDVHISSIF